MNIELPIGPFPGGVNLLDPPSRLEAGELSKCVNWRLDHKGIPEKRPGSGGYGSSPAKVNGDNLVNFACRYYKADGSKKLVAAAGGKLKYGNDASGAWTAIDIDGNPANTMNTSNLCDFIVYKDRLYILDGTKVQRYNGTDDLYAGHFSHAAPTLAETTGGNLTLLATYKYVITSVAGNMGEGPAGAVATKTLTGSNNQINLTNIDDADSECEPTAKNIYRTEGNGEVYYLVAQIGPTTTTYNDTMADSELGDPYIPVHGPQDDSRFATVGHDERTYWFGRAGVNASVVEVSDVGFPDRVLDTEFFAVANNDGDILTGGAKVPGGVIFFKRSSMWLLREYGTGLINISPSVGCTAPFSIVEVPEGVFFLSQKGRVHLFDGTTLVEVGRRVRPELSEDQLTSAAMYRITAAYHKDRYHIAYDPNSANGFNAAVLELDLIGKKWDGPHSNGTLLAPSYYSVWDSALDDGQLAWGEADATQGSYIRIRTRDTHDDGGVDFEAELITGGGITKGLNEKVGIKSFLNATTPVTSSISVGFVNDDGVHQDCEPIAVETSPVSGNVLIWGVGHWGINLWGAGGFTAPSARYGEGTFQTGARARKPRIKISDNATAVTAVIDELIVLMDQLPLK